MIKKKYEIEYIINSSPRILYERIGKPEGLEQWFADSVRISDKYPLNSRINSDKDEDILTFTWNDDEQQAKIIDKKANDFIRFQWIDEPVDNYFEFRIKINNITSEVALIITDFAVDDEIEEEKLLWDSQVTKLKHLLGS